MNTFEILKQNKEISLITYAVFFLRKINKTKIKNFC